MLDPTTIRRDSTIALTIMVLVGVVFGGLPWAAGLLAGGGIGLFNFLLIARLVARLVAGDSNGAQLAIGLSLKTLVSLAGLFLFMQVLHGPAVMVGLGVVVFAISLRGIASIFAAPRDTQEA
ncbi:MAG: ATP synthase subunit I [Alphaproteobacteria bacterium]|nr:ATP synthase subunit I [Alphaproteobacteria bacterium]